MNQLHVYYINTFLDLLPTYPIYETYLAKISTNILTHPSLSILWFMCVPGEQMNSVFKENERKQKCLMSQKAENWMYDFKQSQYYWSHVLSLLFQEIEAFWSKEAIEYISIMSHEGHIHLITCYHLWPLAQVQYHHAPTMKDLFFTGHISSVQSGMC